MEMVIFAWMGVVSAVVLALLGVVALARLAVSSMITSFKVRKIRRAKDVELRKNHIEQMNKRKAENLAVIREKLGEMDDIKTVEKLERINRRRKKREQQDEENEEEWSGSCEDCGAPEQNCECVEETSEEE